MLDKTTLDKTTLDETTLDKTTLDKTTLDKTTLDKALLDEPVLYQFLVCKYLSLLVARKTPFSAFWGTFLSFGFFENFVWIFTLTRKSPFWRFGNFVGYSRGQEKKSIWRFRELWFSRESKPESFSMKAAKNRSFFVH
jgi:hypothetical protein